MLRNSRFYQKADHQGIAGARVWSFGWRGMPETRHQRRGLRDKRLNENVFTNLGEARRIIEE
jgi:hypothetical protein